MQNILIVEDDMDIQELLQEFLQEAGYKADIAGDGVEAVDMFASNPYDLILLDIMLPKIDGFTVCELIRKQSQVPIIMLTALGSEGDQIKGLDLQADDYITKPFSMPVLLRKIVAVLRRTGSREDGEGALILEHSLNELSRKLSSALNDLQAANSRLEADIERERMLEQAQLDFFSAVSHELKTPVTVIKGQLEGMLLNVGKFKERDKYLARSLEVVKSMEGMVQEILTVSRIKSSENTLQEGTFDFSDMVKSEYGIFEDMVVGRGLEWHEDIERGLMLRGDKALLGKVVNNLVSNAIHYSPAGSDIFIMAHSWNGKIQFSIENTGVHLPEGDIPKLFDAFYRVERSRSRQTGGSGLGLYIVKMILEQHGADYLIRNTEQGVCFMIHF